MKEKIHTEPRDIINLILKDHVPLKELIEKVKDPHSDRSEKEILALVRSEIELSKFTAAACRLQ